MDTSLKNGERAGTVEEEDSAKASAEISSTKCDAVKSQVASSLSRFRASGELSHSGSRPKEDTSPPLMSKTEDEVGITEFVDTSEGFSGITKHRWSDFIVHEITPAGDVVVLTETSPPQEEEQVPKAAFRPEWFPEPLWEQIAALAEGGDAAGQVSIPAASFSKEERTKYHGAIKSSFSGLVSNTGEVGGEKAIIVKRATSAPDKHNTFWKHKPWPRDRPKFLHFCLFKENVDTFAALSMLSLDMKLKSNKFHMAGTKDARAKTTQMVAIKQVEASQVWKAASKFDKLAVGNFSYRDAELKLGDLQGNQFDIVLRHVQGSDDVIERRVKSFQDQGFINYYGMQRFGATASSTQSVGRAIIQKNWKEAIDLILSGKEETGKDSMARAQRAWRRSRDPQQAYAMLTGRQQRTTIEGRVLYSLCTVGRSRMAYQEALDRLPTNSRQLYVHAFQSWLWNQLVSRRLRELGMQPRVGDLVLCADEAEAQEACDGEADAGEPAEGESAGDGDHWSSVPATLPKVKALTEADLDQYTIRDVVMPLPGWAVTLPANDCADWYRQLLQQSGVSLTREHCDTMRQYSLAGAYRRLLARPSHVQWRLARYSDPWQDLLQSDLDRARGRPPPQDDPAGGFLALVLQFRLPASCYATMALRELTGTDSSIATQTRLNAAYSQEIARQRAAAGSGARAVPTAAEEGGGSAEEAERAQGTDTSGSERTEKREAPDSTGDPEAKKQKT